MSTISEDFPALTSCKDCGHPFNDSGRDSYGRCGDEIYCWANKHRDWLLEKVEDLREEARHWAPSGVDGAKAYQAGYLRACGDITELIRKRQVKP